jgi:release factor glutamine methyltransferase
VTTAFENARAHPCSLSVVPGVYAPQEDSWLLIDAMDRSGAVAGALVADLCTGSGVVAINAASQGAAAVTAFDVSPDAVRCARVNAAAAGVYVDVHLGSWARAREFGPFDLVVSNPPYVPHDHGVCSVVDGVDPAAAAAWDAGPDGRLVLDPLCTAAAGLLAEGGTLLLVHSEFAGVDRSLNLLRSTGMTAEVVAQRWIPFGPVLSARAQWLERTGRLEPARRTEQLSVIRARKP